MTKEEFESELKLIRDVARLKEQELRHRFAMSNNPYKIGDIITDHYHSIKIEKISTYGTECVYIGTELKKDGTPKKRQENTTMYQSNIRTTQ